MRFSGSVIKMLLQSGTSHILRKLGIINKINGRAFSSADDLSKYTFWQTWYSSQGPKGPLDWFIETNEIYPYIESHIEEISKRHKILSFAELGCGTSQLASFIFKGSRVALQLILIDFVIEALQHQNAFFQNVEPKNNFSSSQFLCANVLKLPLKDSCVTVAFDKGTMDALLKDKCVGQSRAKLMMSEVIRILDVGGRFVQVTDEDPDSRLLLLENLLVTDTKSSDSKAQVIDSCSERLKDEFSNDIREVKLNPEDKLKAPVSWSFKAIPQASSDKEYFMYWCDKT